MSAALDPTFGCLLADGRADKDGYVFHGRSRAHIAAWVQAHGEIPADDKGTPYVLDHLCRRRNCVALHHLELVTQSENEKRKGWRYRARRTICKFGHDLRVHAIVTPEGGRVCRACNRAAEGTRT